MDDNNQNPDLAKQYQDILDRYSKELSSQQPEIPTPPQKPPIPEATVAADLPLPVSKPVLPPIVEPLPIAAPPSNFFKYLFYITLIIFLGVFGTIIYTVFFSGKAGLSQAGPTKITVTPAPTISDQVCELNDQKYAVGESFSAADGCNSCSCTADFTIACTEMACEPTETTLPSDLITFIKNKTIQDSTTKITADQIKIGQSKLVGNYASVAVNVCDDSNNCPGHIVWVTKTNGVWKLVTGGQEPPLCTILAQYKFPADFECIK